MKPDFSKPKARSKSVRTIPTTFSATVRYPVLVEVPGHLEIVREHGSICIRCIDDHQGVMVPVLVDLQVAAERGLVTAHTVKVKQ